MCFVKWCCVCLFVGVWVVEFGVCEVLVVLVVCGEDVFVF